MSPRLLRLLTLRNEPTSDADFFDSLHATERYWLGLA